MRTRRGFGMKLSREYRALVKTNAFEVVLLDYRLPDTDGLAGIQELAGQATGLFYMTDEGQEGRDAWLEKRAPDFSRYLLFGRAPRVQLVVDGTDRKRAKIAMGYDEAIMLS